jgi:hypothetical protein
MLDGLMHAYNSTPYVQTGLSIALELFNLFSAESFDFLFISQYMFFILSSSCRLLAFMWVFQVNV